MRKLLLAAGLALLGAGNLFAQYCPGCVQNSAVAQNAQFNVSSATIRGQLSVGSISISSITVSTVTTGIIVGSGTYLTNLNATQLLLGTAPASALTGSYTGITGLGGVSAGTWNAGIISTRYGGTGANLITATTGYLPYFVGVGSMSALAPGTATYLLQSNASAAPSWTHAPQVLGTNVTAIPMANLTTGELPSGITINDASISTVSASKIIGNISGNALGVTGNVPLTHLSTGTLVSTIVASSITATGVTPGIYGGPIRLVMLTVGSDGRLSSVSQSTFTVNPSSITSGALPAGVTINATQITSGTWPSNVVVSSMSRSGAIPGVYGLAAQVSSFTVGIDGRLTSVGNIPIALPVTQINNGTLPAGVVLPAASVQAGRLASNVVASSVAINGVSPGTYGSSTYAPQITIAANGLITAATQYAILGSSTSVASNIDNNWSHAQTSQSSWTFKSDVLIKGQLTATPPTADFTVLPSGRVGISTGAPVNSLDINGNASIGSSYSGTNSAPSSGLIIQGNTGIGTPLPAAKLHVSSGSEKGVLIDGTAPVTFQIGVSTVVVKVDGTVGLGTASPATKLDVNGNAQFGSTAKSTFSAAGALALASNAGLTLSGSSGLITAGSSVTAGAFFGFGGNLSGISGTLSGGANTYLTKWTGTTSVGNSAVSESASSVTVHLPFQVGGSSLTVVNGNVGISTNAPEATLMISPTNPPGNVFLIGKSSIAVSAVGYMGINTVFPKNYLDVAGSAAFGTYGGANTAGANSVIVGGNIGVGTDVPQSAIHVSSGAILVDGNSTAPLQVGVSTFIVTLGGNVGIGTASPSALLEVAGKVKASSFTVTNTVNTGALAGASGAGLILCQSSGICFQLYQTGAEDGSGAPGFYYSRVNPIASVPQVQLIGNTTNFPSTNIQIKDGRPSWQMWELDSVTGSGCVPGTNASQGCGKWQAIASDRVWKFQSRDGPGAAFNDIFVLAAGTQSVSLNGTYPVALIQPQHLGAAGRRPKNVLDVLGNASFGYGALGDPAVAASSGVAVWGGIFSESSMSVRTPLRSNFGASLFSISTAATTLVPVFDVSSGTTSGYSVALGLVASGAAGNLDINTTGAGHGIVLRRNSSQVGYIDTSSTTDLLLRPNTSKGLIIQSDTVQAVRVSSNTNVVVGTAAEPGIQNRFQVGGGTLAVTVSGHVTTLGTVPTTSSCNSNSPSADSNDMRGSVTFTGGAQSSCQINFINAGGLATPHCTCSDSSAATAVKCLEGAGTLTMSITVAADDKLTYICGW